MFQMKFQKLFTICHKVPSLGHNFHIKSGKKYTVLFCFFFISSHLRKNFHFRIQLVKLILGILGIYKVY